jgi:hypothetical protein
LTLFLFLFSNLSDALFPSVLIAVIIFVTVLCYVREGRNAALEQQLKRIEFGSPLDFHGTLAVEEHRPGSYLRFCKSTDEARNLRFKYRWLVGVGPQAVFDEVTFDRSQGVAELQRKNSLPCNFSDFKAIRMREVAGGRGSGSYWHVELIPHKGKPAPFLTSQREDRRETFENTTPVAKAVSAIMDVPVQVFVAGNVWTLGWPPKAQIDSKSL